ncbi:BnaCnng69130D [Brassica napus]|uniref:BnaCnng69130D protein n=1 Tax=Brassica napus TaxID=3708 RepID=A0A078CQZ7_BRANA|nr:BnaCnng69130D [Brassica napus]
MKMKIFSRPTLLIITVAIVCAGAFPRMSRHSAGRPRQS